MTETEKLVFVDPLDGATESQFPPPEVVADAEKLTLPQVLVTETLRLPGKEPVC